jgi:hypothetical protein
VSCVDIVIVSPNCSRVMTISRECVDAGRSRAAPMPQAQVNTMHVTANRIVLNVNV